MPTLHYFFTAWCVQLNHAESLSLFVDTACIYAEKLFPHPQLSSALGLLNWKPPPMRASL